MMGDALALEGFVVNKDFLVRQTAVFPPKKSFEKELAILLPPPVACQSLSRPIPLDQCAMRYSLRSLGITINTVRNDKYLSIHHHQGEWIHLHYQ